MLWLRHHQLRFLRCLPQSPALRGPVLPPSPPQEWPGHGWCTGGFPAVQSGVPRALFSIVASVGNRHSPPFLSVLFLLSPSLCVFSLSRPISFVLLHCVCCTKYHRPGRLGQQKCIVSWFCGLEIPDQVSAGLVPSQGCEGTVWSRSLSLTYRWPPLPVSLHTVFPSCVCVSLSPKISITVTNIISHATVHSEGQIALLFK